MQGNYLTGALPVKPGTTSLKDAFPGLELAPGIYFAVIMNGYEKVVMKLMV